MEHTCYAFEKLEILAPTLYIQVIKRQLEKTMAIAWTEQHKGFNDTVHNWEGAVLKVERDQNYRIMSDVWGSADWALVWDAQEKRAKQVLVNVYDMQGPDWKPVQIIVDATDEVKQAYRDWQVENKFQALVGTAENAAQQIEKGCIAKVVKGRNGQGTVGPVVVVMDAQYNAGYYHSRVEKKLAIATSDVKVKKALRNGKVAEVYQDVVWVWARNCQRVDIAPVDKDALRKQAEEWVARAA